MNVFLCIINKIISYEKIYMAQLIVFFINKRFNC